MERYRIILHSSDGGCTPIEYDVMRDSHIAAVISAITKLRDHQKLVSGDVDPCDRWRVVHRPPRKLPKNIAVGNSRNTLADYEYLRNEPRGT